ncbi:MAG: FHIPEP family type III secretion protein, partial [Treponema sp.]|nr:FHIPEP family type III secretion protein [Treponema sp.]
MADIARPGGMAVSGSVSGRIRDYIMGIVVVTVVIMFIVPLHPRLLDLFMAMNLAFSLLVLLIVVYSRKPTEFSLFPTVLLVATV